MREIMYPGLAGTPTAGFDGAGVGGYGSVLHALYVQASAVHT